MNIMMVSIVIFINVVKGKIFKIIFLVLINMFFILFILVRSDDFLKTLNERKEKSTSSAQALAKVISIKSPKTKMETKHYFHFNFVG